MAGTSVSLGQPASLFKLCVVEMWERFGFVTTMALTVLYFASPVDGGGLGWEDADAILWVGYFAALLMTMPILGGGIADRFLGAKRAILIGGAMMAAGYLALGLLPHVFLMSGVDPATLKAVFAEADLALAQTDPQPEAWARISAGLATSGSDESIAAIQLAYNVQTAALLGAFLLVACGNALFKPSVSATVGALYSHNDPRRDSGFTLFWTFINAGAFLAYVIGGGIAEAVGWNVGYLIAFAGMTLALAYFLVIQRQLPEPPRRSSSSRSGGARERFTAIERRRIAAILIMIAFSIVFHVCLGQINGLIGLFILEDVDRSIAGMEVPVLWVTSMNPLVILVLAPVAAMLWSYLARRGRNPSSVIKFVLALSILAAGQLIMLIAALEAEGPQAASLIWVVFAIAAMSIAEFPLQPIGLSMVTQLSPSRLVGLMLGMWLFGMAVSNGIGGNVGALATVYGLPAAFFWLAVACLIAAAGLLLLRPLLSRWMAIDNETIPDVPLAATEVGSV